MQNINSVTSLSNPLVMRAVQLHEKKGRMAHQQCLVEGVRAISSFFDAKRQIYHLFVTEDVVDKVPQACPQHKVVLVTERVMRKITTAMTPSGMVAIFVIPKVEAVELSEGLVLAQVQDPGNMGTLIRTAAALNKKTVVIVEGVEPWNPKVIQASAGTIAAVNIVQLSWPELVSKKGKLVLSALVVTGGTDIRTADLADSLLVVGNEANGLPEAWQRDCERLVTLPMPGGTESLNAAIAGSIALYTAYLQTSNLP